MYIEKMLESLGLDPEIFDARDNAHRSHNLVPVSLESEPKNQEENNSITEDTHSRSSSSFPSLDECRKEFERHIDDEIQWTEIDDEDSWGKTDDDNQ